MLATCDSSRECRAVIMLTALKISLDVCFGSLKIGLNSLSNLKFIILWNVKNKIGIGVNK